MKKNLILVVLSIYGILHFTNLSKKESASRSISSISDGELKSKFKSLLQNSQNDIMKSEKSIEEITKELEKVQALKDKKKKHKNKKVSKKYLKEDDIIDSDNSENNLTDINDLINQKKIQESNILLNNFQVANFFNQNNTATINNENNQHSPDKVNTVQAEYTKSYQSKENLLETIQSLSFQLQNISEKNENEYILTLMDCSGESIRLLNPIETELNCGDNHLDLSSLSDGNITFEIIEGDNSYTKYTIKSTIGKFLYHDSVFKGSLFNFDRKNKHHLFNLSQSEIYSEQYMIPENDHSNVIKHTMSLSEFSFAFQMQANDIMTTQTILDFGKNNRGVALIIDDEKLKLRAYSNSKMYELYTNLLKNELYSILISYRNGLFNLAIPELNISKSIEVPNFILKDYGESGYFRNYSRNSFNQFSINMLQNHIKYFKLFNKEISYEQLQVYLENEEEKKSWEVGLEYDFTFKDNNLISNALPIINLNHHSIDNDFLLVNNKTLFQLNDGYFFNKKFSKRSYFFQFQYQSDGYLLDEGGSVNGISLIIENNTIHAHIRNNTNQYNSISYDLSPEDWNNVVFTIDNDQATLWVNGNELVMMLEHNSLNIHPDRGGLFNCYNSSSDNSSCNSHNSGFNGKIRKVYIYDRMLNLDEINYFNNL